MRPVALAPNTLGSFYRGCGRIGSFRADAGVPDEHAEDWIASTTTRWGSNEAGLTRLDGTATLAAAFAEQPQQWLGPRYVGTYGAAGALLTKLLDAGERLPLHVHPDRRFAAAHLDSPFGKSEAWLVLHADPGAGAHLGFARDIDADELERLVAGQQTAQLLAACNQVPLHSGDVVFCPGGIPHAIGAGVLILEIQEMTDFSIMLEWAGFPLDPEALFLGLDRATALGSVHRAAVVGAELAALRGRCITSLATSTTHGVTALLPDAATTLFHAEQVLPGANPASLDARFAVLVINEGSGQLRGEWGELPVTSGQVLAVPYAAGDTEVSGAVSAIRCYPA